MLSPDIDRGRAWLVLIGCFFNQSVIGGNIYSTGLVLLVLSRVFPDEKVMMTLAGAMLSSVMNCSGPIAGLIADKMTCRQAMMLGGLMSSVGFAICAVATDLRLLVFAYGVLVGLGFSIAYVPSTSLIGFNFLRYRNFVNGFNMSGVGWGFLFVGNVAKAAAETYGWRGLFLILSGLCLQTVVFSYLCYPSSLERLHKATPTDVDDCFTSCEQLTNTIGGSKREVHHLTSCEQLTNNIAKCKPDNANNSDNLHIQHLKSMLDVGMSNEQLHVPNFAKNRVDFGVPNDDLHVQNMKNKLDFGLSNENLYINHLRNKLDDGLSCDSLHMQHIKQKLDGGIPTEKLVPNPQDSVPISHKKVPETITSRMRELFTSRSFIVLNLDNFIYGVACSIPIMYIPLYAEECGVADSFSSWLILIVGLSLIFTRIVVCYVVSQWGETYIWYIIHNSVWCCVSFIYPFTASYGPSHIVYAVLFGLCSTPIPVFHNQMTLQLIDIKNLSLAYGVEMMFCGVGFLVGPVIAGIVIQQTESYQGVFFLSGGSLLISIVGEIVNHCFLPPPDTLSETVVIAPLNPLSIARSHLSLTGVLGATSYLKLDVIDERGDVVPWGEAERSPLVNSHHDLRLSIRSLHDSRFTLTSHPGSRILFGSQLIRNSLTGSTGNVSRTESFFLLHDPTGSPMKTSRIDISPLAIESRVDVEAVLAEIESDSDIVDDTSHKSYKTVETDETDDLLANDECVNIDDDIPIVVVHMENETDAVSDWLMNKTETETDSNDLRKDELRSEIIINMETESETGVNNWLLKESDSENDNDCAKDVTKIESEIDSEELYVSYENDISSIAGEFGTTNAGNSEDAPAFDTSTPIDVTSMDVHYAIDVAKELIHESQIIESRYHPSFTENLAIPTILVAEDESETANLIGSSFELSTNDGSESGDSGRGSFDDERVSCHITSNYDNERVPLVTKEENVHHDVTSSYDTDVFVDHVAEPHVHLLCELSTPQIAVGV